MPQDRFLIAPYNTGMQNNLKPWLIPDDAFELMKNAYIWRGRIKKRFGSRVMNQTVDELDQSLYTRVGIKVGTTNGAGILGGTVPGAIFKVGQIFSCSDGITTEIYSIVTPGAAMALSTGLGALSYDTANGMFGLVGGPGNADVYFYPAEPIMGIITYQQAAINEERYIIFDTQFAYEYDGSRFQRLSAETNPGDALWSGTDHDFFWGTTYRGIGANQYYLFVTNFVDADLMRYFDGTTWTSFNPLYNATQTIVTARCIVPFKGRLILLNTVETVGGVNTSFTNRVRYSVVGDPIDPDAWRNDINPSTSFLDAPTREAIVSVALLKDRLMVFFERSTWELVYTGNQNFPFQFQRINSELGIESTFSTVLFDQNVLGIGETGLYACNGSNVVRIDQKIPDQIFDIKFAQDGLSRIQSIRDYFLELTYWLLPLDNGNPSQFPNTVLVYNYRTNSWALNDDSFTALGNFQAQVALTWASTAENWLQATSSWANASINSQFLSIMAGNQQGFVCIIDPGNTKNAQILCISDIFVDPTSPRLTIINHNLEIGDYIEIKNIQSGGNIITDMNNMIFQVQSAPDADTIGVAFNNDGMDIYTGGGTVARVTPIDMTTKQYNFYIKEGINFQINSIDFHVDKTDTGAFNVDYYVNSSNFSLPGNAVDPIGTTIVETSPYQIEPYLTYESLQERLWHRFYPEADGQFIQLRLYLDETNSTDPMVAFSDFTLHAMLFIASRTADRFQ